MGFRFQKRIKILPGITINLSKSGVSTSLGVRGARVTLGRGKTRTTIGIPGTGISHTSTSTTPAEQPNTEPGWSLESIIVLLLIIGLFWFLFG